jgi:hypothetical protein
MLTLFALVPVTLTLFALVPVTLTLVAVVPVTLTLVALVLVTVGRMAAFGHRITLRHGITLRHRITLRRRGDTRIAGGHGATIGPSGGPAGRAPPGRPSGRGSDIPGMLPVRWPADRCCIGSDPDSRSGGDQIWSRRLSLCRRLRGRARAEYLIPPNDHADDEHDQR